MANNGAIDEQRLLRNKYAEEDAEDYSNGEMRSSNYDDDVDPNDLMQPMPMGRNASAGSRSARATGLFDSEDEDDY